MSTGFSGNLGFPLPEDWAFDQISTITVGAGDGAIEIDNNINSGRDSGQNSFNEVPTGTKPDVPFDGASRDAILAELLAYIKSLGDLPEGNVLENPWHYLTPASLDITLQHDALITGLSRAFGMRKALIQTPRAAGGHGAAAHHHGARAAGRPRSGDDAIDADGVDAPA